jgi:Glycosyltransferase family 92
MKYLFFLLFTIFLKLQSLAYEYELSACMIFRNEAEYLKEWIEFHKLVGVQHFYLINHFSSDDYQGVLQPYIDRNEVELFQCQNNKTDNLTFTCVIQPTEYTNIVRFCEGKTKWLMITDLDEFLFPVKCDSLLDFLKEYEEFGGVYVFWQLFGTSYVPKINKNQLLIESLILQSEQDYIYNKWGKSIVRPERVESANIHFCRYKKPYFHVFPNKHRIVDYDIISINSVKIIPQFNVDVSKVRINHYWTRDEDFLFRIKYPRYQHWNEEQLFFERVSQLNKEPNYEIFKYVERLKTIMQNGT